jgi:carbon storage regulator
MLVLTRKSGEEIVVGKNIRVKVIRVEKGRILLGICAPRDVAVHRQEVVQRAEYQGVLLAASPALDGTLSEGARNSGAADDNQMQRVLSY